MRAAIEVPVDDRHLHDLDAMAAEITAATRLVLVCNPNNPTSTALPLDEIAAFVEQVPRHVCVLLDEAYCEFNTLDDPDASIDLLARHPNLVLLRTFSKVHGLCGLRVGYALCGSDEFVTAVNQVRQPFFCNAAAQAAAIEALKHSDAVARARRAHDRRPPGDGGRPRRARHPARPSRRRTSAGSTCPAARTPRPAIVDGPGRSAASWSAPARPSAAPGALRVTYGTPQQNARFLAALRELLA